MPRKYDIGFAEETTFGTFVASANWLPVVMANATPEQQTEEGRYTGAGRSLRYLHSTVLQPAGSITTKWWQEYMGHFLRAALFHDITSTQPDVTNSPSVYLHGFLADDDGSATGSDKSSLSLEVKHTATVVNFLRGAIVNSLDITIEPSSAIELSMELLAIDFVRNGGTWSDAASAPSAGTPSYFANTVSPIYGHQVAVTIGGTVSLNGTTGRLDMTGGTSNTKFESINISINNNLEHVYGMQGQPNPSNIYVSGRDIEVSFDLDFDTVDTTWLDALLANTSKAILITITSAIISDDEAYEIQILIPDFRVTSAPYPDAVGDFSRPIQSVSGKATEGDDGYDISFSIQDTQTAY